MKVPVAVGVPLIVKTFAAHELVTPEGSPVIVIFVAPVVAYVMLAKELFTHTDCVFVPAADVSVNVLDGVTLYLPVMDATPQPPVVVTV